ncbi:GlxA family transcriptional regulator [Streptomyces lydicus]|uniref:GlxA family transcriptional regulator n=1 Tax=Streptomyces lydicus TaxID=47763 RepID=UPI000525DB09|nr:helix-turn-helix domain-containing protein [Streptomyces lydicus]MDC7340533.1 helix-turn-helix domain-containing protein [Streptomyces lydicus]UEG89778.1 helix-turn-helix domain-containing protein [Streptomyces lydicus]
MQSSIHRLVVLALDGVYPFELGIAHRVFDEMPDRYEVVTCTPDGRPVRSSSDFRVAPDHGPEALERADTVVIPPFDLRLLDDGLPAPTATALARIRPGARLVSLCTGAFLLGAAGLLDGRPATTHWALADTFRRMFPRVTVDPDVLFIDDGDVLTSAGAVAGVDLCLHLVRRDHGSELANSIARRCVIPPWREGGQAQYIEQPVPAAGTSGTAATREWALAHLDRPLTLADLAAHAGMSSRTFARRFTEEAGVSPGRWVVQQRVHQARRLLETTDLSVERIAHDVGFGSAISLRQHLNALIGVAPLAYRRAFRTTA